MNIITKDPSVFSLPILMSLVPPWLQGARGAAAVQTSKAKHHFVSKRKSRSLLKTPSSLLPHFIIYSCAPGHPSAVEGLFPLRLHTLQSPNKQSSIRLKRGSHLRWAVELPHFLQGFQCPLAPCQGVCTSTPCHLTLVRVLDFRKMKSCCSSKQGAEERAYTVQHTYIPLLSSKNKRKRQHEIK